MAGQKSDRMLELASMVSSLPSSIFRVTFAAMTCSLAALRTAWRVAVKLRATGRFWMRTGAPRRAVMVMAIAAGVLGG